MHELSIVQAVLDTVEEASLQVGATKVLRVHLRVGELAAVDPDALQFAYGALSEERPLLSGSDLVVEWVPIRVRCPNCGTEGPAQPHSVVCGECGNLFTHVVAGEELDIANVEVERNGKPSGDRAQSPLPQR